MSPAAAPLSSSRARTGQLLLGLVLWVGAAILGSALLGPWLYELVHPLAPAWFPFLRVLRRLAQLIALVGLIGWMRRRGVRRLSDLGLGWSPERRRDLLHGLTWGVIAVVLVFGWELSAGNRVVSLDQLSVARAVKAVVGAAAIGLLGGAVCRGALLFPFAPLRGASLALANVAVSTLFAIAHFARGGGQVTEVDAWSGFRVWRDVPLAVVNYPEAAVGLFLTGVLLYLMAARQGHAWGATGVHAGAVVALQLLGTATRPVAGRQAFFLVDGLLPGWGLALFLATAIGWVALRQR